MDEIHTEYKEKIWGKTIDGEYVIDGFVYRGKRSFANVIENLRKTLKRGFKGAIN